MPNSIAKKYLTTTQAAELLSVSPDTVLKWVKAGKIEARRTLGGHFRIPRAAVESYQAANGANSKRDGIIISPAHQYCWEYLARDGVVRDDCLECITYKSRSSRCYELRDLPDGFGCLRVACQTSCEECAYFQLVKEQGTNILILSETQGLIEDFHNHSHYPELQIKFAENEYECSYMIQEFRPDFIVVDCNIGKNRTSAVCRAMFNDNRLPVARIILAAKDKKLKDYCDRETFGWIKRPFTMQQLRSCIADVVETSIQ